MIPEMIQSIAYQIDKQFGFDFSSQLYGKYPEGISIREDADELFDFVEEQFGRKSSDPRVGAISQTIGFGDDKNRLGQFMMITKVEAKNPGDLSPNDKVHVTFEDGRKTKTSYENFVHGTVNDSKFNKVIDCSGRKFEYTTSGAVKKQEHFAHAVHYYDEKPMEESIENQARMTVADIARIRQQFPIVNGVIINQKERETKTDVSLLRQKRANQSASIADDILEGPGTHGIRHPSFNWNGRDDR